MKVAFISNGSLTCILRKSGITIEFPHQFLRLQPQTNVLWVRGAGARRFEQSYRLIARGLKLKGVDDPQVDVLDLVKEWMIESVVPWLMILDNADDESQYFHQPEPSCDHLDPPGQPTGSAIRPLSEHIPQSANGYVLATSRDKQTAL